MCKCGCNTCETKGPLLMEGKVKSLLSEGLQYHIDKKIPLFETVYRIGSDKHLALIKEARKMYSRNIIDLCEDDEALIGTHLGEFALYEGVAVPLDLPMLEENYSPEFKIGDFVQPIEGATSYLSSYDDNDINNKRILSKYVGQIEDVYINKPENLEMKDGEYLYSVANLNNSEIHSAYGFKESALELISDPTDYIKSLTSYRRLNETNKISSDKLSKLIPNLPKGYVGKNAGIGKYTISTPEGGDIVLTNSKDKKNWFYEPSNVALKILNEIDEDDEYEIASRKLFDMTWDEVRRQNNQDMVQDVHDEVSKDDEEDWDDDDNFYTLRESYDYDEVAQSEFGMDYDQLGSGEKEWVRDEIDNMSMNESDSNYPNFDLNKNIRYQDTSISSGMWRYTGQEQGGKGVYRNLNNGQILAFDKSDFDIFKNNLSSHFDMLESLNEANGGQIKPGDYVKNQHGNIYQRVDGKVGKYDAYVRVTNGKAGKKKTGLHDSFKLTLVKKDELKEDRKYNQEELLRLDLIARRRFDCDYKKCTDEQKAEVLKDKVKVGVKEALQESKKDLDEAEFKGKKVALGKPKRGGPKAYYVYVKDGDKVKKVTFGSGGLRAKIKNKEARNAFAARHNCKDKKDRTKAGYWSCNLPRYAPALGLGAKMNTFW